MLRNSLPGILSTAIFAFLVAWNDYLVALVFLKSSNVFTLPIGLQSFFQPNATDWGLVMAKGSPLTPCVNQALADLRSSGELKKITDQWIGAEAPPLTLE